MPLLRPPATALKPLEIVETVRLRAFLRWLQGQRIRTFAARRQRNGLWSVRVGWEGRRRVRRMGPEGAFWAVAPLEPKA